MLDEDFCFLSDPVNLGRAIDLVELLNSFEQEARIRFTKKLSEAMTATQARLASRWTLESNLESKDNPEFFLRPRKGYLVPVFLVSVIGWDNDDPTQLAPYWGVWCDEDAKPKKKAWDLAKVAIRALLSSSVQHEEDSELLFEYVPEFPRGTKASLLEIIGVNGDRLAERMAEKATEIAEALETAFG